MFGIGPPLDSASGQTQRGRPRMRALQFFLAIATVPPESGSSPNAVGVQFLKILGLDAPKREGRCDGDRLLVV